METKVKNMTSQNGNRVENQFIITIGNVSYFQSYNTIIAKIENGKVLLDEYYWNFSKTTSKYRSIFLGETTKETQKKIDNRTYILANLN